METREPPFSKADLVITPKGRIYHLDLEPLELAHKIIIVGDPARSRLMAQEYLSSIDVDREHRGLVSITGEARSTNERISIITSGMGTPSLEIILQELVALIEIDFDTRKPKDSFEPISIVRVGTSGALQEDLTLGTSVVSEYAIGFDNTGLFYEAPFADENCERIEAELSELLAAHMSASRFKGAIRPYVAKCAPALFEELCVQSEKSGLSFVKGITASNSGFFANQGRDIARLTPSIKDIDRVLAEYNPKIASLRIENMEMESSFLFHYMNGLGHQAASICPTVAHRVSNAFADSYQEQILMAGNAAIQAFSKY